MTDKDVSLEIGRKIRSIDIKKRYKDHHIFLFGENPFTEGIIIALEETGVVLEGILDNDSRKWGRLLAGVEINSPKELSNEEKILILIASQHEEAMRNQLALLAPKAEVISLYNIRQWNNETEYGKFFWESYNCHRERQELKYGRKIYEMVHEGCLILVSPTSSIGDSYLWAAYLQEWQEEYGFKKFKVIVNGAACEKVVSMYGLELVESIAALDMEALVKYILFVGEENANALIIYPRHDPVRYLDLLASWKGWAWHEIYGKCIFKLKNPEKMHFPFIWQPVAVKEIFKEHHLVPGKTVILAPYANTVGELPVRFWEEIVKKLQEMGYSTVTNIAGSQKSIKGTCGLNIPLPAVGTYLEYAGYFLALRSGLCDIAGQAECRQVVLYRDRMQMNASELVFNDLHVNGVAPKAVQLIYDEAGMGRMIDVAVCALID